MLNGIAVTSGVAVGLLILTFVLLFFQARRRAYVPVDWETSELRDTFHPAHSFTQQLSEIDLARPFLYEELVSAHSVRLDWQPPSFTQEWRALGEGHTDTMQAVTS